MRLLFALTSIALMSTPALATNATVSGTDGTGALGTVPCSPGGALPIQSCHAELRHKEDGTATLAVQLPGSDVRRIYFTDGKPTSSSSPSPMTYDVQGETMRIFIEPGEVFELPVAAFANQ